VISLTTARLRPQRSATWAELESLADVAAKENRSLAPGEVQEWNDAVRRLTYLDERIKGALEMETSQCAAGESAGRRSRRV